MKLNPNKVIIFGENNIFLFNGVLFNCQQKQITNIIAPFQSIHHDVKKGALSLMIA